MHEIRPLDGHISANGLRLHYRDWGGAGRPIVLLHGLASNARIWDFVAPRLTAAARVIALDQRGHGGSEGPPQGYGFDEVCADLTAALLALDLRRPLIVGHSWGANVAVCVAAGSAVNPAGIALVDGGVFDLSATPGMTWEEAERTMAPPRIAGTPHDRFLAQGRPGRPLVTGDRGDHHGRVRPRSRWHRGAAADVRAPHGDCPGDLGLSSRETAAVGGLPDPDPACRARRARRERRVRAKAAAAERLAGAARTVWLDDAIHDAPLQHPGRVADAIIAFARELRG